MLKLFSPSTSNQSKTKTCALFAFGVVRIIQAKATRIPCALIEARDDIVAAWHESADLLPNA